MQSISDIQSDQIVRRNGVKGVVVSRTGPRFGGKMDVQSIRIRYENGAIESYDHYMPDDIEIIA